MVVMRRSNWETGSRKMNSREIEWLPSRLEASHGPVLIRLGGDWESQASSTHTGSLAGNSDAHHDTSLASWECSCPGEKAHQNILQCVRVVAMPGRIRMAPGMGDAGGTGQRQQDGTRRDEAIQRGRHVPLSQHGRLLRPLQLQVQLSTTSIPALSIPLFY